MNNRSGGIRKQISKKNKVAKKGETMRKLLAFGNAYAKNSDWTDFALTKFCLCAMGVLLGINIPAKNKKHAASFASGLFVVTYVALIQRMLRLAKTLIHKDDPV